MNNCLVLGLGLVLALLEACPAPAAGQKKDDSGNKTKPFPTGLDALKHTDPNVRYQAALLLTRLGPEGRVAIKALMEALGDKNARVRIVVAYALWTVDQQQPQRLQTKDLEDRVVPVWVAALKD